MIERKWHVFVHQLDQFFFGYAVFPNLTFIHYKKKNIHPVNSARFRLTIMLVAGEIFLNPA